ncbi:MAG: type II secretion system F family protein, partial [bacterium]
MVERLFSRITIKDITQFTREFSAMISAALPMLEALNILNRQTINKTLKKIIGEIVDDIKAGNSLSYSLKKYPAVFNDMYCNMVAAGEAGGFLEKILRQLAEYMEDMQKLRRRIKSALMYPAVIISVSIIVISAMVSFIVPAFAEMFEDLGGSLPAPTIVVIVISDFIAQRYLLIFLISACGILCFIWYKQTPQGELLIHSVLLKIPVLGTLLRRSAVARFSKTLATLLGSGIPILEALKITSKTAGNRVIENGVIRASSSISGGRSIADPLEETGVFPP